MRIIAGEFRRRNIVAPEGPTTRPTTDRVREAVFSMLGPLRGMNVIDCYAGTGAMGLEALSRGATQVWFIETSPPALKAIKKNIETLKCEARTNILSKPLEQCRPTMQKYGPFDLVLSDPPWPIAEKAAIDVAKCFKGLIAKDGTLALGHPKKHPVTLPEELGFSLVERRNWGASALSFYCNTSDLQEEEDNSEDDSDEADASEDFTSEQLTSEEAAESDR